MKFNFLPETNLDGHEAFSLFLIEFGKTIHAGHADPFLAFKATDKVLCVKHDDNIAGFMVYTFNEEFKHTWITFSFVVPEYRGKGLFALMNSRLENITRDLGGNMIQSYVHVDNISALKACEKIERNLIYHMTRKNLVP